MTIVSLTIILIKKLSKEELGALCDAYDNGKFESDVMPALLEKDFDYHPNKYHNEHN